MVLTAGPTLSVPACEIIVGDVICNAREVIWDVVMAGSASSQHAFVPLGAMAHLFIPGTEAVLETSSVSVGGGPRPGNDLRLGVGGRILGLR